MRNYLYDRPGDGAPAQPRPQPARPAVYTPVRAAAARPRKRSPLPWIIAFVVLIASLTATYLILSVLEGDPFSIYAGGGFDGSVIDPWNPFGGDEASGRGETTIPRAPTGDGTVLTIQEERGELLGANGVYEKALPSVVSIQAYSDTSASAGSGIIMSADGYILTNYHIIEGAGSARVMTLNDYRSYEAELVGYAAELDLAVLKVDAQDLTAAEFGSSRGLSVGDAAYALGNPMGYLNGSLTEGIISALGRNVKVGGYNMTLIQTSAPLNSGNSGGALLNDRGQVVGITSAKITSGTDVTAEGLGLAIPISDVRGCINSILACGEVVTPRIGIEAAAAQADGVKGVLVYTVERGGPADAAGLRQEDLITAANGVPVASVEELKDVFFDIGVGKPVELTVLRAGEELTVTIELAGPEE